jgi:hypothetical protein
MLREPSGGICAVDEIRRSSDRVVYRVVARAPRSRRSAFSASRARPGSGRASTAAGTAHVRRPPGCADRRSPFVFAAPSNAASLAVAKRIGMGRTSARYYGRILE